MSEELYKKYRPSSLDQIVGQDPIVSSLVKYLEKGNLPHAIGCFGDSGVGKTTVARILKEELDAECSEVNASSNRGIELVRDIEVRMEYRPMIKKCRLWIVDECFHKDTMVSGERGTTKISNVKVGDMVQTLSGLRKVKNTFRNRVPLDRVVRLQLTNGTVIYTTKQHEFFTNVGWVEAQNLTKESILYGDTDEAMQSVQGRCFREKGQDTTKLLLQSGMCKQSPDTPSQEVSSLWDHVPGAVGEEVLWDEMCRKVPRTRIIEKDEREQPILAPRSDSEGETDKSSQGYASCLERGARGKRENFKASANAERSFEWGMANGVCGEHEEEIPIPIPLQNRHSSPEKENSCGGRWEEPSMEKDYIERHKKRGVSKVVRLESYTDYESGDRREYFQGIITDKEIVQGFVEFYDLEIDGPSASYFANGVAVHNCHLLTPQSQQAFLKVLEDPGPYDYFLLLTSEPTKLIKAIHTRLTRFDFKPLSEEDLAALVRKVAKSEKIKLSESVLASIIEIANGSARLALVNLDKIASVPEDEQSSILQDDPEADPDVAALCKALSKSWAETQKVLTTIKAEPESCRKVILAWFGGAILKGWNAKHAAWILTCFRNPIYEMGKSGLILCCYDVFHAQEG